MNLNNATTQDKQILREHRRRVGALREQQLEIMDGYDEAARNSIELVTSSHDP